MTRRPGARRGLLRARPADRHAAAPRPAATVEHRDRSAGRARTSARSVSRDRRSTQLRAVPVDRTRTTVDAATGSAATGSSPTPRRSSTTAPCSRAPWSSVCHWPRWTGCWSSWSGWRRCSPCSPSAGAVFAARARGGPQSATAEPGRRHRPAGLPAAAGSRRGGTGRTGAAGRRRPRVRGGPGRAGVQPHAEQRRGGAGRPAGERDQGAPVRRRRLARAAQPAGRDPRLCRADPPRAARSCRPTPRTRWRGWSPRPTGCRTWSRTCCCWPGWTPAPISTSQPTDLTEVVVNAVSDARAAGPDHVWRLAVPDEPVMALGDRHRLHQVVANLLANARTHTPPGTEVETGVAVGTGEAVITVTDNGPGIPADIQARVFERFTRADVSRVRTPGAADGRQHRAGPGHRGRGGRGPSRHGSRAAACRAGPSSPSGCRCADAPSSLRVRPSSTARRGSRLRRSTAPLTGARTGCGTAPRSGRRRPAGRRAGRARRSGRPRPPGSGRRPGWWTAGAR